MACITIFGTWTRWTKTRRKVAESRKDRCIQSAMALPLRCRPGADKKLFASGKTEVRQQFIRQPLTQPSTEHRRDIGMRILCRQSFAGAGK